MTNFSRRNLSAALTLVEPELAARLTPDDVEALFSEARALRVEGIAVESAPLNSYWRGDSPVLEMVTSDERWHINTTALRKDALWQLLVGLASILTGQAFLSLAAAVGQFRGVLQKFTRLAPDEGDVAGTLVRLSQELGGPVPRARLEAAYRHDPDRDGPMEDGSRPIDASAVIDRLIDKKVIARTADGSLTVPF
ncbi:hypothetical protein AB0O65_00400 [Microbacterium sp. NPDC077391]|uniref:hypothetical protein n=1 Tax=Microbacterium sp. NPDC077391 TaxID=3154765 RepID=UPI003429CA06